jgi:hypothetical protein
MALDNISNQRSYRAFSRRQCVGHVYVEVYLLTALFLISLAVGMSRYQKEGFLGVAIATLAAAAIIVIGGTILIYGLGTISLGHDKLKSFTLYRKFAAVTMHLLRFLMFVGFAAFVWMIIAMRFDLAGLWHQKFIMIISASTGVILFVIHWRFRQKFWPAFNLFCGGVFFLLLGAVIGLLLGDIPLNASPLKGMDLGAIAALVIYLAWLIKRKFTGHTVRL